jgi:hypothetical protein
VSARQNTLHDHHRRGFNLVERYFADMTVDVIWSGRFASMYPPRFWVSAPRARSEPKE